MGCIYIATNVVNNKQYVGQTVADLARRRWAHENLSQHPERRGYGVFHRAIAKHGAYNFRWETLCLAEEHELNELEALAIEMNGTTLPRGYNMTTGGGCCRKVVAGKRKHRQEVLPKYITRTDHGYIAKHYPSGSQTAFQSQQDSMETKLEKAKSWLQKVEGGETVQSRVGAPPRKHKEDCELPTGIYALRRDDRIVGYKCRANGHTTSFIYKHIPLEEVLQASHRWLQDAKSSNLPPGFRSWHVGWKASRTL